MTQQALLEVRDLIREFPAGEGTIQVLKNINLSIYSGELVAIVGQSGSGKSTLMNILGCLDRPTQGYYQVNGHETGQLEPDELAKLRREYFGFIFQRYHLLNDLSAEGNVEVPSVYASAAPSERKNRAKTLLTALGLESKTQNRPNQLSGGQQQRVSIARALMNGGDVILADEPTGALDSNSGIEVMRILRALNAAGHTIILVTHDMDVAKNATRIIELKDGEVIADRSNSQKVLENSNDASSHHAVLDSNTQKGKKVSAVRSSLDRLSEAFRMALLAMNAHRMRTFLTMLGIIIGIASVVTVVALGRGTQEEILKEISSLGTNTITVMQGKGFGDNSKTANFKTLIPSDADALATQPYVSAVSPLVNTSKVIRFQENEATASINGVGRDFFMVKGLSFQEGQGFDENSVRIRAQDVVIDTNTQKQFFSHLRSPVGQVILLGSVPARIIGVIAPPTNTAGLSDSLNVYMPYTTVMSRMLGQSNLRNILVLVNDKYSTDAADNAIVNLLTQRHGAQDIYTMNSDSIRQTIEKTTNTMTLLVSAIAVISLIVGGIGVMNIMLVSVTERTQEIGVRMAVGARQSDILQQFLIEAILVCLLGGVLGVLLSLGLGQLLTQLSGGSFTLSYSTLSIVAAFVCSTLIGVVFGFLPAKNAAKLDPVAALARE
ncbi:MacB family efflux pump subunit [Acinetobacter boissieri]|uniref:Pyoverdine export ATP-binding/permease protein PvdT n=1 Tax=Acinetobacter boissieri TaxID=1219383 RepID=A0A1G6GGF4_9GAMM|nr:MacB family efflux pump subunit [Acinetobacter boissieri]SDB81044.1 macrolide transport system ATP-binding/permease protein [Acinetobacter boissieri]